MFKIFFPQILFKTTSGEWQSVLFQDSVSTTTTPTTSVATTTTSPPAGTKKTTAGGRKERTLAKIAPAGGMIALNTSQLSSAAQAVQTISINGVQVQGVPVTITNAGGELMCLTPRGQNSGGKYVYWSTVFRCSFEVFVPQVTLYFISVTAYRGIL